MSIRESFPPPRTVADVMNADVVTVSPAATARELAAILWENGISGAPVIADGRLIGLVSSRDLLWLADRKDAREAGSFLDWEGLDRFTARDLMTPDVFGIAADADLEELRAFFVRSGVNRAPVLDGERLVGIVSLADLLGVIARARPIASAAPSAGVTMRPLS